jgi:hypothetical protein
MTVAISTDYGKERIVGEKMEIRYVPVRSQSRLGGTTGGGFVGGTRARPGPSLRAPGI